MGPGGGSRFTTLWRPEGRTVVTTRTLPRRRWRSAHPAGTSPARCRQKFLRVFPRGFRDETYLQWERDYKWTVHKEWQAVLDRRTFEELLSAGAYADIATRALRTEQRARHSMIFSFEKMALRDAVRSPSGARAFAEGLYAWLHGPGSEGDRFDAWVATVDALPRRQTRVLTWPIVTVFGWIADPNRHLFVKPTVTRIAAERYGFDLPYQSRPSWSTYRAVLDFAAMVRRDVADLRPRDLIDIQSFMWVQGSPEYA
jgi:hypothetical protein